MIGRNQFSNAFYSDDKFVRVCQEIVLHYEDCMTCQNFEIGMHQDYSANQSKSF